jgi:hypothetical protein
MDYLSALDIIRQKEYLLLIIGKLVQSQMKFK